MSSSVSGCDGGGLGSPPEPWSQILTRAQGVADDIAGRIGRSVDAATVLGGRAALLDLCPRGRISAGGATRLLPAETGWCAITLSRADDVGAVPALTEALEVGADPWPAVAHWVATRSAHAVLERAGLFGIPAAGLGETAPAGPVVQRLGEAQSMPPNLGGLLVADLSSMWAGPLCGHLLAAAGATVVKVESPTRPDGTRAGPAAFFDWMNAEKLSYAVDFDHESDQLRMLLTVADVVIEGSRPAALHRRGLGPDSIPARPGRVWVRITGHGATGVAANRVAFGDDAAVAGALIGYADGAPAFCGDAVADPLSGLEAARAVLASLSRGGGELIGVSMAAVAATYAALPAIGTIGREARPRRPSPSAAASRLGADNPAVHRIVAERLTAAC